MLSNDEPPIRGWGEERGQKGGKKGGRKRRAKRANERREKERRKEERVYRVTRGLGSTRGRLRIG